MRLDRAERGSYGPLMKAAITKLLLLAFIAAATAPVAAGISILIFDTGCVFGLCGLEGLVYGGLAIWAALIVGVLLLARWKGRRA